MNADAVTAVSIGSLEGSGLRVLRIRLGETRLVPSLANHLARMGFTTTSVADDTIEVTPMAPVNADYDNCTMRAYFRAWHKLHSDVEVELSS